MVPARVDERLVLGELFPRLGRQLVPRGRQPADGHVAESHQDGEERVVIVVLSAAERNENRSRVNTIVIRRSRDTANEKRRQS